MSKLFTSISECRRTPREQCTFHRKTNINKIILLLIGIELFFVSIFAISGPFVSVFIAQGISGGTITIVGIASMIFLVTKSVLQIPLAIGLMLISLYFSARKINKVCNSC